MPASQPVPRSSDTGARRRGRGASGPVDAAIDRAVRAAWGPVTIRVAWELVVTRGGTPRPEHVAEAREHVLRCLPDLATPAEAEERASALVADWVGRVKEARYRRVAPPPDHDVPVHREWRHRLNSALDPVAAGLFLQHYGDGFSLAQAARICAVPVARLEAARAGIREAIKLVALEDGVDMTGWPVARVDALLGRVARVPEAGCPGPGGLLTEEGRAHADRCPRCTRAVRLVRHGALSPADLFPPPEGRPARPEGRLRLLALLLHPDARKHRDTVTAALRGVAVPVAGDAWLIDARQLDELAPVLEELALAGTPARHHLRGAMACASGRWVRRHVLGPAPVAAVDAARAQPWGEVQGVPELPAPLPPPPKATRWWAGAAVAVVLAVGAVAWTVSPEAPTPTWPVEAAFTAHGPALAPTAWTLRFDTDELAVVDVVARVDGRLEIVHRGVREDKGRWATGDGAYQIDVTGEDVAVLTSRAGVPGLDVRVAQARSAPDPVGALLAGLQADALGVDVARSPRPEPPAADGAAAGVGPGAPAGERPENAADPDLPPAP